ncbi:hypothetical protein ACQVPL_23050 [Bacillus hominis]
MELITMCMGGAIVVLGAGYFSGGVTIPPALVTGISISGFCLTLSDFIIKMDIGHKNFIKSESTQIKLVVIMHVLAVCGIIVFPNIVFIEYVSKENLDFISTFASVVALGSVILAIGYNNRKEVVEDITKLRGDADKFLKRLPELEKELQESRNEALQNKNDVEELKVLLKEAQEELRHQSK